VLRPVPKRARDPLATGAIFRASPAALRSPMPRLLLASPKSRVIVSSAGVGAAEQLPAGDTGQQQQNAGGTGDLGGRFGHLSSRFDELYSKSPTPKVLLHRMGMAQAQQLSSKPSAHPAASASPAHRGVSDTRPGGAATFATPSPRPPAAKKAAFAVSHTTVARSENQAAAAERKNARNAQADTPASAKALTRDRAAVAASPSAMSEDMDIDDLNDGVTPQPGATALDTAEQSGGRGSRRGASVLNSSNSESSRRALVKEAPRPSSAETHTQSATGTRSIATVDGGGASSLPSCAAAAEILGPERGGGGGMGVSGSRTKRKAAITLDLHNEVLATARREDGEKRAGRVTESESDKRVLSSRAKPKESDSLSLRTPTTQTHVCLCEQTQKS
jgi:hypothetical protein